MHWRSLVNLADSDRPFRFLHFDVTVSVALLKCIFTTVTFRVESCYRMGVSYWTLRLRFFCTSSAKAQTHLNSFLRFWSRSLPFDFFLDCSSEFIKPWHRKLEPGLDVCFERLHFCKLIGCWNEVDGGISQLTGSYSTWRPGDPRCWRWLPKYVSLSPSLTSSGIGRGKPRIIYQTTTPYRHASCS